MDTFIIFGNNYFIPQAFILPIFMSNKLYMKIIFTLFAIGMLFTISTEAKTINKLNTVGINTIVDSIPAQFPGGKEAWVEYLNSKLARFLSNKFSIESKDYDNRTSSLYFCLNQQSKLYYTVKRT